MEQTTVSSRIPEPLNEALESASESRGVFRSEIIRRAIRYYIEENPDDLEALRKDTGSEPLEMGLGFSSDTVCSQRVDPSEE